jgi:signal transduction histidine kinase
MQPAKIECPWCGMETKVADVAKVSVYGIHGEVEPEDFLEEAGKAGRLICCENRSCWAPCEVIFCANTKVAEDVRRLLSRIVWSSPRRVPATNEGGIQYSQYCAVLFNRRPLERWREIRLSSLVNVHLIAKLLAHHAHVSSSPVTLFEAWATARDEETFWLPVQPTGSRGPGAAKFRETCTAVRNVFEPAAFEEFRRDSQRGAACPYFKTPDCPTGSECPADEKDEQLLGRCLRFLAACKRVNACYQSDLRIINKMGECFVKGGLSETEPYRDVCWAGYRELCYPVVVHEHLVGAVMTGQFDTRNTPETAEGFVARERKWRDEYSNESPCVLLEPKTADIRQAIAIGQGRPRGAPPAEVRRDLEDDIRDLVKLAEERYLRQRSLTEAAFRQELGGRATGHLSRGGDLKDLLPMILTRMRVFWAFEHTALCVMTDTESKVRLIATPEGFCPWPGTPLTASGFDHLAEEFGAYALVTCRSHENPAFAPCWAGLQNELAALIGVPAKSAERLTMYVVARHGPRIHIYCFFGRDILLTSGLQYKRYDAAPVSREAQEQILRTCEQLSGLLHHFWARDDREQMYRMLSHSLKSLIVTMRKGAGLTGDDMEQQGQAIQSIFPELFNDVQELLESLSLGGKAVVHELESIAAVANLELLRREAREGTTDLSKLVGAAEPIYRWRSRAEAIRVGEKIVGRPIVWRFNLPDSALVQGRPEAISLAVRNLLDNAFKYSYPGREVQVSIKLGEDDVTFAVSNQGVPIEDSELGRVWERDYRGYRVRRRQVKAEEGTGFGLFVVKEVMNAVEGKCRIECQLLTESEGRTTVALTFRRVKQK